MDGAFGLFNRSPYYRDKESCQCLLNVFSCRFRGFGKTEVAIRAAFKGRGQQQTSRHSGANNHISVPALPHFYRRLNLFLFGYLTDLERPNKSRNAEVVSRRKVGYSYWYIN
jgi:hypothetical protein